MLQSHPATVEHEMPGTASNLAARFASVCGRFGDRTALTLGSDFLTYAELNRKSDRVASALIARGATSGSIVGICLERSFDLVAAMLGVAKAGAAYLPLDPAYPAARLAETIADAQPLLVIGEDYVRVAELLDAAVTKLPSASLDDAAYVIYTSGSTGRPKGVVVTQRNLLRLIDATEHWFHFNPQDVWTMFHSFAFDFSVWEMWAPLLTGGRLVLVPFTVSRSPEDFYKLLVSERVTVLNQTPSAFALLDAEEARIGAGDLVLRTIIFGGEALALGSLRGWFGRHGDEQPTLVNMYGITETTVHVTYRRIFAGDAERENDSLIGEPIPDMQLYLLDANLLPVKNGDEGEICVGGGGVANGYLNRPELTAERFVLNPFTPGARLYRSGDMARRRTDGELVYLGRRDGQVKINGFRIELGEIESALAKHPNVAQACVLARASETTGTRLIAYAVPRIGATLTTAELSTFLASKLPMHMRPALYQVLPALPLTVNGKVDRAALPEPSHATVNAPTGNEIEQKVASVWQRVLSTDAVGLDENFFDVGGSSLLLIAVRTGLQEQLATDIPVVWMFECATIRTLAAKIGGRTQAPATTDAKDKATLQKMAFARARAARGAAH